MTWSEETEGSVMLKSVVEAMLFVTDESVSVLTLADMLEVEEREVQQALEELQAELAQQERGIQLREAAGGWRLVTHPRHHDLLERYVVSWDTRKLSQAALETLAVVAYCQPVTRNGIASVRGVSSDSSVNSLVEKGLVREVGVQDTPGNPVLYGTTKTFLERFGLATVADLPPLESFAPDEETREFIASRLNVVSVDPDTVARLESDAEQPFALEERVEVDLELESGSVQDAMQALLGEALAQGVGAVEKIDFSQLVFDEDE